MNDTVKLPANSTYTKSNKPDMNENETDEDIEKLYAEMVSEEREPENCDKMSSLGKDKPLFLTDLTEKNLFAEAVAKSRVDQDIFPGVWH